MTEEELQQIENSFSRPVSYPQVLAVVDALRQARERFTAPIVCLCGSTRFWRAFLDWYSRLTDEGKIVLTVGRVVAQSEAALGEERKVALDDLHKRKIDLCDEVFVLDVGGYVGSSTRGEIAHAEKIGRPVRYLSREFPEYAEPESPEFIESLARKHAEEALAASRSRELPADAVLRVEDILARDNPDWQRSACEEQARSIIAALVRP